MVDEAELSITRVVGTSARSPQTFEVRDNLIAYTASGGVVVGTIASNAIINQRFFCANSSSSSSTCTLANAYLDMALEKEASETPRDRFGIPIVSEPTTVSASSTIIDDERAEESPSKLKDRVRSVNCVAISPNKQLLLVGEIGYLPRILVFSLAPDLNCKPVVAIHEHTFGIMGVAFLPDLRLFCSLGLVNDGCLHVWRISAGLQVSLQATNRCSSVINELIWHENHIITSGLRFVKVWTEPEAREGKTTALKGKNVVLGQWLNSLFDRMCVLSSDELLLATAQNQLFLLKLGDTPRIVLLSAPCAVGAFVADGTSDGAIWAEGERKEKEADEQENIKGTSEDQGNSENREIEKNQENLKKGEDQISTIAHPSLIKLLFSSLVPGDSQPSLLANHSIIKIANLRDSLVYLCDEAIVLYDKHTAATTVLASTVARGLVGVKKTHSGTVLAYSANGEVRELSRAVDLRFVYQLKMDSGDFLPNELTCVDLRGTELVMGDKYGEIYVVESGRVVYDVKAHSSSVNDVIFVDVDGVSVIVSIGRDRMIQIFCRSGQSWDVHQTLPIHNGNLLGAIYTNGRLFVSSSDRTISVHRMHIDDLKKGEKDEKVKDNDTEEKEVSNEEENASVLRVYQEKILPLKSTPLSMDVNNGELVVSLSDKTVHVYDTTTLEYKRSLHLMNDKTGDRIMVENLVVSDGRLITTCSDKSLRCFLYPKGRPISVGWGHLDCITSLVLKDDGELLTTGTNGCLFTWDLLRKSEDAVVGEFESPEKYEHPVYAKVARKIIPTVHMNEREEQRMKRVDGKKPERENLRIRSDKDDPRVKSPEKEDLRLKSPQKEDQANLEEPVRVMRKLPMVEHEKPDTRDSITADNTPKLTAATLKRIEYRKSLMEAGKSPPKSPPKSPVRSPVRSPSKSTVPSLSRRSSTLTLSPRKPEEARLSEGRSEVKRLSEETGEGGKRYMEGKRNEGKRFLEGKKMEGKGPIEDKSMETKGILEKRPIEREANRPWVAIDEKQEMSESKVLRESKRSDQEGVDSSYATPKQVLPSLTLIEQSMERLLQVQQALPEMAQHEREQVLDRMQIILQQYERDTTSVLEKYSNRLVALVEKKLDKPRPSSLMFKFDEVD